MEPYVTLTVENSIGYIEFYHPDHNAMPSENLEQLESKIVEAGNDDAIKVVVLKSGGNRTFCAGASFKELVTINNAETGKQFFMGFANVINAMRKSPKLIIGRVQGKAVGGGVGLIAATDYCMATKYASIKLSELSIGIGPFVIEPVVSRKIGLAAMSELTLNPESLYPPEYAIEKGLFAQLYNDVDDLDKSVNGLAEKLSSYNPEALKKMKAVLWQGTEDWDKLLAERAAISGELVLSEFTKKTLLLFL